MTEVALDKLVKPLPESGWKIKREAFCRNNTALQRQEAYQAAGKIPKVLGRAAV